MAKQQEKPALAASLAAYCRAHPVLIGLLVLGGVGGAVLAVWLPVAPESLSIVRRVFGGALAGVLFAMCALGFRLFD